MSTTKTTKKTQQRRRADWSLRARGPVSATVEAGTSLLITSGAGHLAHISPVWGAVGAIVGALGHTLVSADRDYGPGPTAYRIGCWVGAGGWLTWTWADAGPFHSTPLAALAVGAIGAGITAPLARPKPISRGSGSRSGDRPGTEVVPADRPAGELGSEWERRFLRVLRIRIRVTGMQPWETGAGYTLTCEFPPGAYTRARVAAAAEALATDARLPDGCGIEPPQPGSHRGEFLLPIATKNLFGDRGDEHPPKAPYPADYSPRSILDMIPLGVGRDGTEHGPRLREESMLLSGPKGSGKTNTADVSTSGVARCRDAIVWHLDLNGGGMSQFWLKPWLDGETERPPIDWAASHPLEGLFMVKVAVAIAKARKRLYRQRKADANTKLLPLGPDLPQIVLLVDEGKEMLSPNQKDPITAQIREGLEQLLDIGRNEAVIPSFTVLRPVSTTLSPDVLAGCAYRAAMHGTSAQDLGHIYEWTQGISPDDLPVKGVMFWSGKPWAPVPVKGYYMEPAQIRDAARQIATYRPELDEASAKVANADLGIRLGPKGTPNTQFSDLYADRYERMRADFTGEGDAEDDQDDETTAAPAPAAPQRPATPAPAAAGGGTRFQVINGGSAADWPDPAELANPAPQANTSDAASWPDPPATPALDPATGPALNAPTGDQEAPEILARARRAFLAAGDSKMWSESLAEALGITDVWQLAEALRPYDVQPRETKITRGGVRKRGYWLDDIEDAIRDARHAHAN